MNVFFSGQQGFPAIKTVFMMALACLPLPGRGQQDGASLKPVPPSELKVVHCDSEEVDAEKAMGSYAVDGNPTTFWHTQWRWASPSFPHELIVALAQPRTLGGVELRRRLKAANPPNAFEVSVSQDCMTWTLACSGNYPSNQPAAFFPFAAPMAARWIKLVILSSHDKKPFIALAEFTPMMASPLSYRLDLSKSEPRTDDPLPNQGGKALDGTVYAATRNGFSVNGRPWFPVSGEFHYVRYPQEFWDAELAKMKAGGIDIVATYVFWNHHEQPQGKWDWTGRRDLKRFLQLAQQRGLKVWLRLGPYINAETNNGGIPDFAKKGSRTNDPDYLAKVNAYFKELALRTKGMMAKDGGPIIGIQLDNEFANGDAKHITQLREMATSHGLIAPFYTVTANSRFEKDTAIPLQGGYVYRGWEKGGGSGAVSGFVFGSDEWTANTDLGGAYYPTLDYPRGYCELGTGSPMRGPTRFCVDPRYVIATAYDALGRGANYLGYYMFHGGTQVAELSSGWPLTYDFQAPLGEYGRMRESYRLYRRLHLFVHTYAEELLASRIVRDPEQVMDPKQTSRLRYIGRFDKEGRGFVFISNIQRNVALPPRPAVQIEIESPSGTTHFPDAPFTVPADRYAFFPVKTDLGGALLEQATVEPVAKMCNPREPPLFVYWKPDWTDGALRFGQGCEVTDAAGKPLITAADTQRVVHAATDRRSFFQVTKGGQAVADIVVLTEAESLNAAIVECGGKKRLIITGPETQVASISPGLELFGTAGRAACFDIVPFTGLTPDIGWQRVESLPPFAGYRMSLGSEITPPKLVPVQAGTWKILCNRQDWKRLAEARLDLQYAGSEAKLFLGDKEYSNDLYHNESWGLDLMHFRDDQESLTIRISGWDANITGADKPMVAMPSISATEWRPLVRVPFMR